MKNINWNNVEDAKKFKTLIPNGYVCGITKTEDVPEKEYIKFRYEILEGEYAGYFVNLYEKFDFWGGTFIKSYKQKALPFFKGMITAFEQSNDGFKFNNDENTLVGKTIGLVLGEEEYRANDGSCKTRLYVAHITAADNIRKGNFKVPEKKILSDGLASVTRVINNNNNDELPW